MPTHDLTVPVNWVPGLRNSEMEGIINLLGKQAIGRNDRLHVGGFQRDNRIRESELFENPDMIEGALHHGLRRRITILLEQPAFQRPRIHADADGNLLLLRAAHHQANFIRLADVPGINAQLVDSGIQRHQSELILKVNIRDEDRVGAALTNFGQGLCRFHVRDRKTHDLAARCLHLLDLLDGLPNLARVRLGHRLHNDGGVATNGEAADPHGARLAARRKIFGIAEIHESLLSLVSGTVVSGPREQETFA